MVDRGHAGMGATTHSAMIWPPAGSHLAFDPRCSVGPPNEATLMASRRLQGLCRRKNKFPVGDVTVMLFEPLAVVIRKLFTPHPAGLATFVFSCKV